MELRKVLPIFITSLFVEVNSMVQCYRCDVTPANPFTLQRRVCSTFDYSDKFVVDCPYSTMCMKRTLSYSLPNGGVVVAVARDCAPQRNEFTRWNKTKWITESEVHEPYQEGCINATDTRSGHFTSECFCRGSLCNASTRPHLAQEFTDLASVVLVINLLKYIYTLTD